MNILSLFDGISCGQVALKRAGIKIDKYYASEIDKYAIQITQKNFPNTIQLGDVNKYSEWELPKIDLLIGGSPCQDLSVSKKDRQGLKGERSKLFYIYVECLKNFKPKWFLLENVNSMPKEAKEEITRLLGVEPIMINSALVSAQQRKRLYWTNIPGITQPEDKHIYLQDILESGLSYIDKSQMVGANYQKATVYDSLEKHRRTLVACPVKYCDDKNLAHILRPFGSKAQIVTEEDKKSPTILAAMGTGGGNGIYCAEKFKNYSQEQRVYSVRSKSVLLKINTVNEGIKTVLYKINLPDGDYCIRKLTPLECERLRRFSILYRELIGGIMDKKTSKIITTVLLSIFLIAVVGLTLRFFGVLWNMDDDLMFIYGFTLTVIASVTFLFIFLSESIASIWKKKKIKKGESYGKEEKRN